jgi:4'-phosphopantetheinyl transferase
VSRGEAPVVTRPPSPPPLEARAGHVEVWATGLDRAPAVLARMRAILADDETARAARFHFERDARRFVVARAVLRELLGAYLAVTPREVSFVNGPRDKPGLAPPLDASGVQFNVSHSGEIALYAVTRHRPVGVDVEQVRALDNLAALAERNFSRAERAALFALPPAHRPAAFFACWTRKEAYVKALGEGLAHPLDAFTVSLAAGEPARVTEIGGDAAAAQRWTLAALDVAPGYEAAVAVDGPATVAMRGFWNQPPGS